MSDPNDPIQRRATLLPIFLAALLGGFLCLVMILITGGFFFYVLGIGLLLVLLGLFHYMLWGRALSEQVAAEREEMNLLEKAREQPRPPDWQYRR